MSILITRPEPDASATTKRLVELGYACLSLPATKIIATGTSLPHTPFAALLATSANAFRMLQAADITRLKSRPLHCVGEKTAKIARDLGFLSVIVAGGSGAKLVSDIKTTYSPEAKFLYLTGTPRKPIVEDELRKAGYEVTSIELYHAQPVNAWPDAPPEVLRQVDAALHFSRASVETLLHLAEQSDVLAQLKTIPHLCLSDDVASPLIKIHCPIVACSMAANENSLLELLARVLP